MNDTTEAIETIGFVARSSCRVGILDVLAADGCLPRGELRNRFDVSRTTVGRNLAALEDRGLIRRTNGGYMASHTGTAVAEAFGDLVETVEITAELESFVQWLPEGFDLDLALLADAEVTLAERGDPYAPVNRHDEALGDIDEGRALLAVTGLNPMRTLAERVVENGATFEAVVEPTVAETFQSNPSYADCYEEMVETGRFELFVTDEPIPYYVGLLDDTVQVGLEDNDGLPRALLESDSTALREWGTAVYERHKRDAERVV